MADVIEAALAVDTCTCWRQELRQYAHRTTYRTLAAKMAVLAAQASIHLAGAHRRAFAHARTHAKRYLDGRATLESNRHGDGEVVAIRRVGAPTLQLVCAKISACKHLPPISELACMAISLATRPYLTLARTRPV